MCGKYYGEDKKEDLTPGIFALWCTHGVCVGWHLMRVAEGTLSRG